MSPLLISKIKRGCIGIAVVAFLFSAVKLGAYRLDTDHTGNITYAWRQGPIPVRVLMPSDVVVSDGHTLSSSVVEAMAVWNRSIDTVAFVPELFAPGSYGSGNGVNEIVMDSTYDGDAFGARTLAVTLSDWEVNDIVESDIVFNNAYTWDSYRGVLRDTTEDIHRVALHELGHTLGLLHPDQAGQRVTAIMNSTVSWLDTLTADDIDGAQVLYGPPGYVPPNDDFADAIRIHPRPGSSSAFGSSINATLEPGEPVHDETPEGRSVWWSYRAPETSVINVDTLGSSFDTVMAVYTGTEIGALTKVVSNDDVESGVLRHSSVSFPSVRGEIYYIAVDGWDAWMGRVQVNVSTHVLDNYPYISLDPFDQTVEAGSDVTFSVQVEPHSAIPDSYQWRRDGVPMVNQTTSSLTLFNVGMMDSGAVFDVVVSRGMQSDISDEAVLTVFQTVFPPSILTQPAGATVTLGSTAQLSVAATGTEPISYQWQINGDAIPGATSASLSFDQVSRFDHGTYTVVLTNEIGTVTSAPVELNVLSVPVVTSAPRDAIVRFGESVTFEVEGQGFPAPSYQWRKDGVALPGSVASTLTLTDLQLADGGTYDVVLSNTQGETISRRVRVILADSDSVPVITAQPRDQIIAVGLPVVF